MSLKRCTWYEVVQLFILIFTMSLMLSKHYHFFERIFSFFYESEFAILSVIIGAYSILHGLYMLFKSFGKESLI